MIALNIDYTNLSKKSLLITDNGNSTFRFKQQYFTNNYSGNIDYSVLQMVCPYYKMVRSLF
jgi:hypothetical protein